ncbi:aminoacyl-histidine dipeptidase [Clostridium tagluense]|uniref:aminoacyl-histidine dipeptidase n=1 Tax=Clostridium tagluense TaxID=360422 RepID=UPI001C0B15EA|nr:aminoacyl-histidine dipeptidase [Clostridium tagluense]MBU3130334.1 aminoacyl-histidine dipeptidase [Clostridium tagluense]MBW9159100.1 aminoacyl-histidine dipeptidase [Clostridium tagluense]MCB2313902.1 aminoacyl-histidine dipeptidase [Clostridium tagluense]MCB2318729.1 aminoacyl-histidine dipeptidase [Clostridium tagluense]MCB2323474.1 aminoacyl-histidine dipeptidase [Clostridium tagluense]
MLEKLKGLNSYEAFKYFKEMNEVPRGSGNEKGISDWLVSFAKKHNLNVIQDSALNVIIKKPATKGYEKAPIIIIQGHMDMVCEKNTEVVHDFEKDPIAFIVEEDFLRAGGTTLGADNGIAVAFGLAVLAATDISHPALELLVTTEEETGMGGAQAIDPKNLDGRILINIDSEEEGKLLVSCAGGVREKIVLPITWEESDKNFINCEVKLIGLNGGHSGMEINKERGNAIKLMGRFLMDLKSTIDFKINNINGGAKNNAIPREADAIILFRENDKGIVIEKIAQWNAILKNELTVTDPEVNLAMEIMDNKVKRTFSDDTATKALQILFLIPNGVKNMSMAIEGLVQSSTNIGVLTTSDKEVVFDSAVRSSVRTLKKAICDETIVLAEMTGATIEFQSDYPEWQYNPKSQIRTILEKVYNDINGNKPEIAAIHAGLECGLISEKFGGKIDQISFGPNIYDVHTPKEHLSISSTDRMWSFLVAILKEIK